MNGHSSDELRELYRELILDHARSPRHFGRLTNATHEAAGINPLCGDKLRLYLQVGTDDRIAASSFEGSGCAISMASASLLTDTIIGEPIDRAEAFFDQVTRRLTDDDPGDLDARLEKLRALDGVKEFPARVKCATLAWHALHSALNHEPETATTE